MSKAKGLSFSTVRVSKLVADDRGALDPLPLIVPKNTPRADGRSSTLPEASRSVVANALFRASYQVRTYDGTFCQPSSMADIRCERVVQAVWWSARIVHSTINSCT